ncbi:MAG: helix-turn-helix domain-containing protein [Azoarcus sp.]|nr:helix-turn-helix domain-containing protein [Azoarcus sp.]
MKKVEAHLLTPKELAQTQLLGSKIRRLRYARRMQQAEAALRANMSPPTARKIENGDPSRTLGQVLRYLGAISPGLTLLQLLEDKDPILLAQQAKDQNRRVRELTKAERAKLDF